ncbi:hypothetical protein [Paraburkholderia sp. HD33-4]|uniref:hypothetical protein n=1 Tax=Paraburkholderia sp. HD33-4 TaxID=2883242 RepID=UPI001F323E17|nr:hypothetical protein [Paraburkholderia sp. HD33-4]
METSELVAISAAVRAVVPLALLLSFMLFLIQVLACLAGIVYLARQFATWITG